MHPAAGFALCQLGIAGPGFGHEGGFIAQRHNGIDLGIEPTDASQARLHHLGTGDLTGMDGARQGEGVEFVDGGHGEQSGFRADPAVCQKPAAKARQGRPNPALAL